MHLTVSRQGHSDYILPAALLFKAFGYVYIPQFFHL